MTEPSGPIEADSLADEELAQWVAAIRRDPGPPARELGASALRAASRRRARERPPGPQVAEVRAVDVASTALAGRLYRPTLAPRPLIVFLHGGMWVFGDLDTHDRTCRRLARAVDAVVLAVDYRRAPESPWPAAIEDAVHAIRWATAVQRALGGDGREVAVAGDSAGGQLSMSAALCLRDGFGRVPRALLLACPNADLTLSQPSVVAKGSGWGLDADDLAWAVRQWVPAGVDRSGGNVSPLYADDLTGLPPAVVVTAEHDPLRDEGDALACALADAGSQVCHRCEAGMVHGFVQNMDLISPAAGAATERFFVCAKALVHGGG